MSQTTVIVNPIAGRGAGVRLAPQIEKWLRSDGLDFDLVHTSAPGHATVLARDAVAHGQSVVVAVGGDGTVNEVLNGVMEAQEVTGGAAVGILPIGTGNDWAFGAGLSLDLRQACQVLARGQSRAIDVGCIQADNDKRLFFGNAVGIGFDAMVNIESRKLKRLRGFLIYLVALFKTLAFYYYAPVTEICIDGEQIVQPCLMISVMNGFRVGGGFIVTPGARMDDGLFDVCVTPKVSRPEMVRFVPRFMRGTHVTDPRVIMARGCSVTISSDLPWQAQVDGEIYGVGARRYEIELFPQRLHLIC